MHSADTRTAFPKVVISTIEVYPTIIVPVSLLEVIIYVATLEPSMATLEPSEAIPIDSWVLIDVFPIILVVEAILVIFTQELI